MRLDYGQWQPPESAGGAVPVGIGAR